MPERYITNPGCSDENAIPMALEKVQELCLIHTHNSVIIHIPGLDNLRSLGNDFDQNFLNRLRRDKHAIFNGINFTLNTERLDISDWTEDIVLSIYPTLRMFDNLNDLNRALAIVVVPWIDRDREQWIRTWNPEIIGEEEEIFETIDIDPRLEGALLALTDRINISTGLTHPSDRESAIQILRILHRNNVPFNPDNIRIWVLRNGWTSDGANQLHDIAQGILEGRRFRISNQNVWHDNFIRDLLGN